MISLDLNILENAPGQMTNYDFDSMIVFDGKLILAGASGIHERDSSGTDNGTVISAYGKTGNSDLGSVRQKRLRKAYTTYEAYASGVTLGFYFDEALAYTKTLSPTNGVQESARVNCQRNGKGSTLAIKFTNVAGADFSISAFELTPIFLGAKPQGT